MGTDGSYTCANRNTLFTHTNLQSLGDWRKGVFIYIALNEHYQAVLMISCVLCLLSEFVSYSRIGLCPIKCVELKYFIHVARKP